MKIKTKLQELITYYEVTRGVGHSRILHDGIDSSLDAILIKMRGPNTKNNISINSLNRLRGRKNPLALDNSVLYYLLKGALEEINRLESFATEYEV